MVKRNVLLFLVLVLVSGRLLAAPAAPDTVKVGVYIVSVHDINFHDKEYTVRFWLWFVYKARKAGEGPRFDFADQIDITNAKEIDQPKIISDTVNGKVWVQMKMKCTMKENWKVHDFPFDQQHLKVVLENTEFDNSELVFVADTVDSRFDNLQVLDAWKVDGFKVSTQNNTYKTGFGEPRLERSNNAFSAFVFEMDIEREALGLFMKIFIGMYIAFLIAMVSFFSDPGELEPRFGLPVGGLFAAVGNKYIIDSLLPESSQFSLVDTLHSLTFFGIFGILTVSAIALKLHNQNKIKESRQVNKIGAIVVLTAYFATNAYFVAVAWRT
jgi:hypothetical protein